MTLDTIIIASGAFVVLLPFLQLPPSWMTPLLFVAGCIVIALGIVVRRRSGAQAQEQKHSSHFVDTVPSQEAQHETQEHAQ